MAECAWAAIYTMRDPKGKTAADLFPTIFADDEETQPQPGISEEEAAEMQQMMASMNASNK